MSNIESEASDAEMTLFKKLFRDYNRLIRPVKNNSKPLDVEFGLTMSQLIDVVIYYNRQLYNSPIHTSLQHSCVTDYIDHFSAAAQRDVLQGYVI